MVNIFCFCDSFNLTGVKNALLVVLVERVERMDGNWGGEGTCLLTDHVKQSPPAPPPSLLHHPSLVSSPSAPCFSPSQLHPDMLTHHLCMDGCAQTPQKWPAHAYVCAGNLLVGWPHPTEWLLKKKKNLLFTPKGGGDGEHLVRGRVKTGDIPASHSSWVSSVVSSLCTCKNNEASAII